MAKPAGKPRKKANGYKMPDPLPNGLVVVDLAKRKWKLGPSIGKGGFGEIYSAQEYTDSKSNKNYPYVVKIEPHENGPLFVEMHFYMRNAKIADIETFKTNNKLSSLGMPEYLGSGSHEHNGQKYRFIVMKKFGNDIWKLFVENKRKFPTETVFKLGIQIFDVLQYIHSKGYIHADVKGANVLLSLGKEAQTQVYLVDFGLCTHYANEYKPDPKKAHNGTIEYLSRDAHQGVESRRGDLEILGYNMVQWLGCKLPWEKDLSDPVAVKQSKEKHMSNLTGFFKACFGSEKPPDALVEYFKYIVNLKVEADPDYKKLRKILLSGLQAAGGSFGTPLKFKLTDSTPGKRKAVVDSATPDKKAKITPKKINVDVNPEETDGVENGIKEGRKKKVAKKTKASERLNASEDNTEGFTAEMLRIKNKIKSKKQGVVQKTNSERSLRDRKVVNYRESSLGGGGGDRNQNVSTDMFSDLEDAETEVKVLKTPTKRTRRS